LKSVKYQATEALVISKQRARAPRCPIWEPLAHIYDKSKSTGQK